MTNPNDFAFNDSETRIKSVTEDGSKEYYQPPLTKREYFAAMRKEPYSGNDTLPFGVAKLVMGSEAPTDPLENLKWWVMALEKFAVMRADALINALNKYQ